MTAVSCAVMAHPSRRNHVSELVASLDRPPAVVYDDRHGPATSDPSRRWRTGRRAWQAAAEHADPDGWVLILQDDAIASRDLIAGCERMLDRTPPDSVVSLYYGTRRPQVDRCDYAATLAAEHHASWIRLDRILWGVAIAAPANTVDGMLTACSRRRHQQRPYDTRVATHYQQQGMQALHTWPSLVDHRQGPSLCGLRDVGRRAHLHHTGSALDLAWDGPTVDATLWTPQVTETAGHGAPR